MCIFWERCKMNTIRTIIYIFVLSLLLSGCLALNAKKVEDPSIPLKRPGYSILPPGADWIYVEQMQEGEYVINFGKPSTSNTYTEIATITEIHNYIEYGNQEEFLSDVKKSILNMDPRRFNLLVERVSLSDKFGPYCVEFYSKVEDHNAKNASGVPYLILEIYGYHFLHPTVENLYINVGYSQRGLLEELNPDFENSAKKFIDGLNVEGI